MEINDVDEKLIKRIEKLKPITPLTSEFIETLSGRLRVRALALMEKKNSRPYQRWYFWSGILMPLALLVLLIVGNYDGFVYKQLPLLNKVAVIQNNGFDDLLKKNKVDLSLESKSVVTVPDEIKSFETEAGPSLRAMKLGPVEDSGSAVSVGGNVPEASASQAPQALMFNSSEQIQVAPKIMPISPVLEELPKKEVVKKFVLDTKLPVLAKTGLVYKVSEGLTEEVIKNLYEFMGDSYVTTNKLSENNITLTANQTFGLVATIDKQKGKVIFSKNEAKWKIRFLRMIMMPKIIDVDQAKLTADDFIKGIGYGLNEVGYVETNKSNDSWQVKYYQQLEDYNVEDLSGGRKLLATIEVDSLLNKVASAEINWFSYQTSTYDLITDQIKLEKIISAGGYNLKDSNYSNQTIGEGKLVLLSLDNLMVPSLVFHLGQDNLYVPLLEKIWK